MIQPILRGMLLAAVVLCLGFLLVPVAVDAATAAFAPSVALASDLQQDLPEPLTGFQQDAPDETGEAHAEHICNPDQTATLSNGLVSFRCKEAAGSIQYFATNSSNHQIVDRWVATLLTAQAINSRVIVDYSASQGSNPPGCSSKCRRINGLYLWD